MKEVDLNKDDFWYDNGIVSKLDMSNGKHIRFTAQDRNYNLTVETPNKRISKFPVPDDGTYHVYEITGSEDQTYTFTIDQSEPGGTVPQMIVRVN